MLTELRKVWFKIHEEGKRSDKTWGSDVFITTGTPYKFTVPKSLAPGNYIVRYELCRVVPGHYKS